MKVDFLTYLLRQTLLMDKTNLIYPSKNSEMQFPSYSINPAITNLRMNNETYVCKKLDHTILKYKWINTTCLIQLIKEL